MREIEIGANSPPEAARDSSGGKTAALTPRRAIGPTPGQIARERALQDELDARASELSSARAQLDRSRDRIAQLTASEVTIANGRAVAVERLAAMRSMLRGAALTRVWRSARLRDELRVLRAWSKAASRWPAAAAAEIARLEEQLDAARAELTSAFEELDIQRSAAAEALRRWADERDELVDGTADAAVRAAMAAAEAAAAEAHARTAEAEDAAAEAHACATDAAHAATAANARVAEAEDAAELIRLSLAHERASTDAVRAECESWRQRALELEASLDAAEEAMAARAERTAELVAPSPARRGWADDDEASGRSALRAADALRAANDEPPLQFGYAAGPPPPPAARIDGTALAQLLGAVEADARAAHESIVQTLVETLAERQALSERACAAEAAAREVAASSAVAVLPVTPHESLSSRIAALGTAAEQVATAQLASARLTSAQLTTALGRASLEGAAREAALAAELAAVEAAARGASVRAERAIAVAESERADSLELRAALDDAVDAAEAADARAQAATDLAADADARLAEAHARAAVKTDELTRTLAVARASERAALRAARADARGAFERSAEGQAALLWNLDARTTIEAERALRAQLEREVRSLKARRDANAAAAATTSAAASRALVSKLLAILDGQRRVGAARALATWRAGVRLARTRLAAALSDASTLGRELAAVRATAAAERVGAPDAAHARAIAHAERVAARARVEAERKVHAAALARSHAERDALRDAARDAANAAAGAAAVAEAERERAAALDRQLGRSRALLDNVREQLDRQRLGYEAALRELRLALELAG